MNDMTLDPASCGFERLCVVGLPDSRDAGAKRYGDRWPTWWVAGSQFGQGSGRTAAFILGALTGAAVGGAVGRSMAEHHRTMTAQTLETVRTGVSSEWVTPTQRTATPWYLHAPMAARMVLAANTKCVRRLADVWCTCGAPLAAIPMAAGVHRTEGEAINMFAP